MMKNIQLLSLILIISFIMCRKNPDEIPNNNGTEAVRNSENTIIDDNEINANKLLPSSENIDVDELSVELSGINKPGINIMDTDNNKFIGYVNFHEIYPELHIGGIYIYEKYIVLEEFFQNGKYWFLGGFNVYEYNKEFKYSEYKTKGKKLYSVIGEPYWFQGISDDLVFSDIGTGPGIRGIEIFDLATNTTVLDGAHYGSFGFSNNTVSGLVFFEEIIRDKNIEDYVAKVYYEYLEKTEVPEKDEKHEGFFQEFILYYSYNIKTQEISNFFGTYIYMFYDSPLRRWRGIKPVCE